MKNYSLLCFVVLALSACTSSHFGNFTHLPPKALAVLAQDSVNQLKPLYPPAQHQFKLPQSRRDGYGSALAHLLRQQGYGLSDSGTVALNYVMDEPTAGQLYRLTLRVGEATLSRAYALKEGIPQPLGAWTYQEGV